MEKCNCTTECKNCKCEITKELKSIQNKSNDLIEVLLRGNLDQQNEATKKLEKLKEKETELVGILNKPTI